MHKFFPQSAFIAFIQSVSRSRLSFQLSKSSLVRIVLSTLGKPCMVVSPDGQRLKSGIALINGTGHHSATEETAKNSFFLLYRQSS